MHPRPISAPQLLLSAISLRVQVIYNQHPAPVPHYAPPALTACLKSSPGQPVESTRRRVYQWKTLTTPSAHQDKQR